MRSDVMYIEVKDGVTGPARIARVRRTKSGRGLYLDGVLLQPSTGGGTKSNHIDPDGVEYWVSRPRADGQDRLYPGLVEIDEDVREEYWTEIRGRPDLVTRTSFRSEGKHSSRRAPGTMKRPAKGPRRGGLPARAQALLLVGLDCAVDDRNLGLAIGRLVGRTVIVKAADQFPRESGGEWARLARSIGDKLRLEPRALVALDAPLGWPAPLARALQDHQAGEHLTVMAHDMFRRTTDAVVKQRIGRQPLDVGADRIARTAHDALRRLDDLRRASGRAIPLAWTPGQLDETAAIEVYPAGTLVARGIRVQGYKGKEGRKARARIIRSLCKAGDLECDDALRRQMLASDHVLDAVVCLVAAADFMLRQVLLPSDDGLARREGWIWVRPPADEPGFDRLDAGAE